MKAALHVIDSAERRANLEIGPQDMERPISYYGEILRAFRHLNMMIPVAAADWFSRLQAGPAGGVAAFHQTQDSYVAECRAAFG